MNPLHFIHLYTHYSPCDAYAYAYAYAYTPGLWTSPPSIPCQSNCRISPMGSLLAPRPNHRIIHPNKRPLWSRPVTSNHNRKCMTIPLNTNLPPNLRPPTRPQPNRAPTLHLINKHFHLCAAHIARPVTSNPRRAIHCGARRNRKP